MEKKHYFLKELSYKRWDDALDEYLKLNGQITWAEFYEQKAAMEKYKSQKIEEIQKIRKIKIPKNQGNTEI